MRVISVAIFFSLLFSAFSPVFGQAPRRTCLPVSERAGRDAGCWLMASEALGALSGPTVYWHLDAYPAVAAAEAAKGPRGTVVEALGKVWVFTIGEVGWRPSSGGERVAQIGPLQVKSGEAYTALYAEGISNVGAVTPVHRHPGPEAWYTATGEMCVETPAGKTIGRAGETTIIPADTPITLIATGSEQRRSIWLVLHETAHPWTHPVPEWTPKGLCSSP
jgi:mannose-6-phosphate isomerase-like protein (cupin superfamily)